MTERMSRPVTALAALVLAALPAAWMSLTAQTPATDGSALTISVVSSRADMVTGGDAVIRIGGGGGWSGPTVSVNGKPVALKNHFKTGPGSVSQGLLTGLPLGKSVVEVKTAASKATLEVTNYPITGPVFSGPHQKPFVCQTDVWDLGAPLDENCSAATKVDLDVQVHGAGAGERGRRVQASADVRAAADRSGRDDDQRPACAVHRSTRDRHDQPSGLPDRLPGRSRCGGTDARESAGRWNGRLIYTFGGGCMAGYQQGDDSGGVMNDLHLSAGYAVASSSLNAFNNNCNGVLSAETLMMVKERFIETVGVPKHTIGWGGSGGAMAQYVIAQNYPGLLNGIIPSATFPDATTYFIESEDCRMVLRPYLNTTSLTDEQKRAIGGFSTWGTCDRSYANRPGRVNPVDCDAAIPQALRYHPVTNPKGARCSIYDGMVDNLRARSEDRALRRSPHDNVGVQYGLGALNAGVITKDVFLDLNEKVGGFDIDARPQAARTAGDPDAIRIAFESGMTNSGAGGLREVPIIDARSYTDPTGDFHESYHSFKARARLVKANGHANNQVMLRAQGQIFTKIQGEYLAQMDRWLDAIAADTSATPLPEKVVRTKPADLVDACWTSEGQKIVEPAVYGKTSECNTLFPPGSAPRLASRCAARGRCVEVRVEADRCERLQGRVHGRGEGQAEGHLPGGRLRLEQTRAAREAAEGYLAEILGSKGIAVSSGLGR